MSQQLEVPPESKLIDGFQMPAMFSDDAFRSAVKYKPRDDDVFIVTYPKCGTTWAQNVLVLIFRHGEPLENVGEFFKATPFLEMTGASAAETMPRPGAIKVHLPFHLTPWSDKAKYIYVTRNPKDCCVSYFHHNKNIPVHGFKGTFDDFFERFISGRTDYGDYFDHVMGWYEHRNDPNILFLTYEDMKKDIEGCILKMASFIDDAKYAEPLRNNPQMMQNVIQYSSFNHMKEVFNKGMDQMFSMSKEDIMNSDIPDEMKKMMLKMEEKKPEAVEKNPQSMNFVRKGVVGDWKNHFSEEQSKRLEDKFVERTKCTEVANFWKEYMH